MSQAFLIVSSQTESRSALVCTVIGRAGQLIGLGRARARTVVEAATARS